MFISIFKDEFDKFFKYKKLFRILKIILSKYFTKIFIGISINKY